MNKYLSIVLAVITLSGCSTFVLEGVSYNSPTEYAVAVRRMESRCSANFTPLKAPVVDRNLVVYLPSDAAWLASRATIAGNNTEFMRNMAREHPVLKAQLSNIRSMAKIINGLNVFESSQVKQYNSPAQQVPTTGGDMLVYKMAQVTGTQDIWVYVRSGENPRPLYLDSSEVRCEARMESLLNELKAAALR